jgi:ATP-dependent Clp protease adaptor protein ClpS
VTVDTSGQFETEGGVATRLDDVWVTIVWNDPVNLMSYVTHVFQTYFGFTREVAATHMREVHENGRSVLASGPREKMEVDVQAMHSYGLWATLQRSGE